MPSGNSPAKRGRSKTKSSDSPVKAKADKKGKNVDKRVSKSKTPSKSAQKNKKKPRQSLSKEESKSISKLKKEVLKLQKENDELKGGKDKKGRGKKDKAAPKKAKGAYIMFTTEMIPKLKKDPEYLGKGEKNGWKIVNGEELKHTDFMGFAAERWGKLTDKQKEPYIKLEEADKIRAEKQKKEFEENGWFTHEDGTKSEPSKEAKAVEPESDDEPVKKIVSKKKGKKAAAEPAKKGKKEAKEETKEEQLLFGSAEESSS